MNSKLSEVKHTIELLEDLVQNGELLRELPEETRVALFRAAGRLSRPGYNDKKKRFQSSLKFHRKTKLVSARQARAETGIRQARAEAVYQPPPKVISESEFAAAKSPLHAPRTCHICKITFSQLHHFYDSMCGPCGDFNYAKRFQTASLQGQVALITGARLKIGYQASLMMLRAGAHVIATTRFPVDAALRYARESDFSNWKDRLNIYGLDLRHSPSVELFAHFILSKIKRLDILINNAAQTVRRPPGFYAHLLENETRGADFLSTEVRSLLSSFEECKAQLGLETSPAITWHHQTPGIGIKDSARLSQIPYSYDSELRAEDVFPEAKLDADLQQIDLRRVNSWRLKLSEIASEEMLEVQLVNAVAPFILCNRLVPLMKRDPTGQKHIVNVTAMEGKFHRTKKIDRHPHTNMAKAALNMLTHTSAGDLVKSGIFMNAVDTGWVTDEDPAELSALKQAVHDFQPPLDIVDGAARVCDPFFNGIITGTHWCGQFLKDYKPTDW